MDSGTDAMITTNSKLRSDERSTYTPHGVVSLHRPVSWSRATIKVLVECLASMLLKVLMM